MKKEPSERPPGVVDLLTSTHPPTPTATPNPKLRGRSRSLSRVGFEFASRLSSSRQRNFNSSRCAAACSINVINISSRDRRRPTHSSTECSWNQPGFNLQLKVTPRAGPTWESQSSGSCTARNALPGLVRKLSVMHMLLSVNDVAMIQIRIGPRSVPYINNVSYKRTGD